jgi:predicted acetyltransferase
VAITGIQVRACEQGDLATVVRIDELAFGYTYEGDPALSTEMAVFEIDRTLMACLDGEPVGIASAYSLRMSVPGGEAPVAGVTWVGVVPTARRRGVLRAMMAFQLADVHARGEALAALFAAEPAIYGRFGYGLASKQLALLVPRGAGGLDAPQDPTLTARILPVAQAGRPVAQVYDAVRGQRAGLPARDETWWLRCSDDQPAHRNGASELRALVVTDAQQARAYALFNVKEDWSNGSSASTVEIRESLAADPAASGLLWRMLLSMDLVGSVSVRRVATDDPLISQLHDPRRARPQLLDALYVRIVDLPAALSARDYTRDWAGVVEVTDTDCPWNQGRWRLELGPDAVTIELTEAEPDLSLDVRELGGAYLGSSALVARAIAGQVREHTSGAVRGLSSALRHEPEPFCPFVF